MTTFSDFYDRRIVDAELEAINLRKHDANKTAFWLWPPFGPTEERERELTAPKVAVPITAMDNLLMQAATQCTLQQAYAQSQLMAHSAMQNTYRGHNQSLFGNLFGNGF